MASRSSAFAVLVLVVEPSMSTAKIVLWCGGLVCSPVVTSALLLVLTVALTIEDWA
jgi:hypothetical protein